MDMKTIITMRLQKEENKKNPSNFKGILPYYYHLYYGTIVLITKLTKFTAIIAITIYELIPT